ncbi:hypothetical protein [Brevundimonas sp.]|uniref:hypothetical protein n=1 Tax=Brevundimonas sp. TaxID=1871086 RepID=UPI0028A0F23E|nr:hypothetical protein [Brevundimonas sp.]
MPLQLPSHPGPATVSIGMVKASNDLSPAFAGTDQQIRRKGSRYALTFTMPSLTYTEAMPWMADLGAEGDTVIMDVVQPGLVIPAGGDPRVLGGGQAGASLTIDGLDAGYAIRKGQFFSLITSGQRYLYRAAQAVNANASGVAVIPLQTMLRRPPADNDVVEIVQPKIEGFVRDFDDPEVQVDHEVVLTFTIRERR